MSEATENPTIKKILDEGKITQDEYDLLFKPKIDITKDSYEKKLFDIVLQKIINLQKDEHILFLTGIKFLYFVFKNYKFNMNQEIDFSNAWFYYPTEFSGTTFTKQVYFMAAVFTHETNFSIVKFLDRADFMNTQFLSKVEFRGSTSKEPLFFSNMSFRKINLTGSKFDDVDFYNLHGIIEDNIVTPTKRNFANKESVEKIKSILEKQNNIIEANKYFRVKQELYIYDLKKDKREPNRIANLFVLYLNKIVSDFGTDWFRTLLLLFMLSYLFILVYINLDAYLGTDKHIKHFTDITDIQYIWTMLVSWGLLYLSTFFKSNKLRFWCLITLGIFIGIIGLYTYDNVLAMQNYIIQLTNPINAFKNMNLYEGIELYGAIVRITVVTIMYQFIVAFRQNTRRK